MRIIAGLPVLSIIPNLNIQVNTGKKGKKRKKKLGKMTIKGYNENIGRPRRSV